MTKIKDVACGLTVVLMIRSELIRAVYKPLELRPYFGVQEKPLYSSHLLFSDPSCVT